MSKAWFDQVVLFFVMEVELKDRKPSDSSESCTDEKSYHSVKEDSRAQDVVKEGKEDVVRPIEGKGGQADPDAVIDPATLDWDGPDDMDNPHNWPAWKKWYATMTVALLCLVVTMGSSLYVSSVPVFQARYHVSRTLGLAGLTFYLLGLSTVIFAPLSEVFGRKPIYLFTLPISMLFTMGVALSNGHMRMILPLRFFSGLFACPALSVGSGTVMDIFDFDEVSTAAVLFSLAPFLGPVISPIMSSFAVEAQGWRWTQYIQLIAGGVILPFIFVLPETHKGIILKKRAKKRNLNLKEFTKEEQKQFLKVVLTMTTLRPVKMLVVEPIVLVFSIYVAFIFAVLFGFFEAYPIIYSGVYGMSSGVSSLPFLGIGIGLWLGALFYIVVDRKILFPKAPPGTPELENSTSNRTTPYRGERDPKTNELLPVVPERFLLGCKCGAVALPVALFWQAWTARPDVHWMSPVAAGVPFGFGLINIFFSVIIYFTQCFPPLMVASALAANSLLRYVVCSVFPLFTVQMYENLKVKWASTLFALICVAMLPIPWIFERWGSKIRRRSQFGYAAMIKTENEREETDGDNYDDNDQATLSRVATLQVYDDSHSMASVKRTSSRVSNGGTSGRSQAVIRAEPQESMYDHLESDHSEASLSDRTSDKV